MSVTKDLIVDNIGCFGRGCYVINNIPGSRRKIQLAIVLVKMELLIHHSFILDLKNLNQKLNFNFLKGKISTSTYLGPEDPSLLTRFEHLHTYTALFRPFLLLICSTEMHLQGAQQNCSHLVICSFVGFYSCKLQKLGHF